MKSFAPRILPWISYFYLQSKRALYRRYSMFGCNFRQLVPWESKKISSSLLGSITSFSAVREGNLSAGGVVSWRCRSGSIHRTPVVPNFPWAFCYCREVFDIPVTAVGHRTKHPRTVRIDSSAHSTQEQSVSKCVSKPSTPRIVHVLAPGRRSNNRADWLQTSHQLVTSRSTLHYITFYTTNNIWNESYQTCGCNYITLHYTFWSVSEFFFAYTSSRGSIICRLIRPSVFRRPDSLAMILSRLLLDMDMRSKTHRPFHRKIEWLPLAVFLETYFCLLRPILTSTITELDTRFWDGRMEGECNCFWRALTRTNQLEKPLFI